MNAPQTFAPSPTSALGPIEASLLALLTASELHEPDAPAAKAYRATMRTRGEEALATGGPDALAYLLRRVTEAAPDRAEVREAILCVAWAGLPGQRY